MDRINWKQPAGWIPSLVDLTSRWMCAVSFTNRQLCPQGNVLSKRLDNPQSFWLWRIKNTEAETCMSETGLQVWGSGLELASRRFVINSLLPTSNTWKPDIYVYIYIYIYIYICVVFYRVFWIPTLNFTADRYYKTTSLHIFYRWAFLKFTSIALYSDIIILSIANIGTSVFIQYFYLP